jgi:signal transduction histidine kinase/DNA-binding response OmpR family regulator
MNSSKNIFAKFLNKSILIVLLGLLLFVFSVIAIIANRDSQRKIKEIERLHVALPFEMSRLFNEVNLASAAQGNYYITGDSSFEITRKAIWKDTIKPLFYSLQSRKKNLPPEDTVLVQQALSALEDYEIAQDEMNLVWHEVKTAKTEAERIKAQNKLNEWRLTLTALTQDDAAAVLVPLQNKYQARANAEMQAINSSINKSNGTILLAVIIALLFFILLAIRQKELVTAKQQAEEGSKTKSEFLANMSHEIRTPLNGVIGFSDLLMKTGLNSSQQQYMGAVSQSANLLLDIINDILDFSKIEAGKLELSVAQTDIYELGSQTTDIVKYQAHKKGLELLLNIAPHLPRFLWADEVRLRQVLVNLLSNAVKFTEAGEIEFKVEALESKTGGSTLFRFSVRDTGIGIDPANQQKVFEAFSQEDGSTTKRFGGTGLGLTISNKLLSLMGSRLQLQSQPGQGSTFYFDVRFKTMEGEPIAWEAISSIKNALVVDDNANNRHILKDMLALWSIEADEAKNGTEALEKLNAGNHYDVVLMDYHMPGMDGIETIRKIRARKVSASEQPVILLHSSSDDAQINSICKELQVRRWMVKPIKIDQLYTALSQLSSPAKQEAVQKIINTVTAETQQNTTQKLKVLIAEDNTVNMLLCRTFIQKIAPHAVIVEAQNGQEAAALFITARPDIVFMDVQMPVLNGYDATTEIRKLETGGRVPIIALTAGTVKGEKEKCLAAGMDDYLSKPLVRATMEQMMHTWLGKEKLN